MSNDALLMTGMALRAGRLEAGDEAAGDACRRKRCRLLLVAADAGESARRRADRFAGEGRCLLVELPCSREELGAALGRKSCAMAAVTDLGLAQAIVEKLVQADPEAFGETAERLRLKAARAAQRKEKKAGDLRREKTAGGPVQYNRKRKE